MSSGPDTPTFPPHPTPFGFRYTNEEEKMEVSKSPNVESIGDEIEDDIEDVTPTEVRRSPCSEIQNGKGVLVKSVATVDASADTVFEVVLNLDRHQRYEWDMLTGDLELVDFLISICLEFVELFRQRPYYAIFLLLVCFLTPYIGLYSASKTSSCSMKILC